MVKFAHTGMEEAEIVDNLMAAAAGVAQRVPGKWDNIQGAFHTVHRAPCTVHRAPCTVHGAEPSLHVLPVCADS